MDEFDYTSSLMNNLDNIHSSSNLNELLKQEQIAREAERIKIRNEERWFNAVILLLVAVITGLFTVMLEQFFK